MGSAATEKKKRQRQRRAAGVPAPPPPPPPATTTPTTNKKKKKRRLVDETALRTASLHLSRATLARVLAVPCPVHAHGSPGASCWPLRGLPPRARAACDARIEESIR